MEYRRMDGTGAAPSLLGFGCMRFPVDRETKRIDEERASAMLRRAMEGGVNYFDTAWPYHLGQSEPFLGRALDEFPRESYYLATKLPCWEVESLDRAREIFQAQLERLHKDYVDFYLLHSLSRRTWRRMLELGVVDWCEEQQRLGLIRRFGFSFHDAYDAFEEILTARKWDFCQIQLNYMDTGHQAGMRGYALAEKLGVPLVIMEPVKGGSLAQLPREASQPLRALAPDRSDAGWALSWAASLPNVKVVLSGMSTMEQVEDNLKLFRQFRALTEEEKRGVDRAAAALRARVKNGCTGCAYCMPCPKGVNIPKNFSIWNAMGMYENQRLARRAWKELTPGASAASCVACGLCREKCPQRLDIPGDLARAREELNGFTGVAR